jgi:hypothetical protein
LQPSNQPNLTFERDWLRQPLNSTLDMKNAMNRPFLHSLLLTLVSVSCAGCAIPKNSSTLIPPVGSTRERELADGRECLGEAQSRAQIPLTEEESRRIGDRETGRFFQGGSGRNGMSDRYVLCFLNKNYQWLQTPVNWMPESKCERLSKFQSSGLEKERLKYLCETRYREEKCDVCQSLQ